MRDKSNSQRDVSSLKPNDKIWRMITVLLVKLGVWDDFIGKIYLCIHFYIVFYNDAKSLTKCLCCLYPQRYQIKVAS